MANYVSSKRKNIEATTSSSSATTTSAHQSSSTSIQSCTEPETNSNYDVQLAPVDDVFEKLFDDSMNNLEDAAGEADGYETDSESDNNSVSSAESASSVQILVANMPPKYSDKLHCRDSSDSDEEGEQIITAINKSPNLIPTDTKNSDIFVYRPFLQPFQERRRLSQCKEEEEEDSNLSPQPSSHEKFVPTPPPPMALLDTPMEIGKFEELEKLRQEFMEKLEANSKLETPKTKKEKKSQPLKKCLEVKEDDDKQEFKVIKGKFTITKTKAAETPEINKLRKEAINLKEASVATNAHTITFPCGSDKYSSIKGLFDGNIKDFTPHLDKKYFDTSLVEIRHDPESNNSLIERKSFVGGLDEVWIKRKTTPSVKEFLGGNESLLTTDEDVSILIFATISLFCNEILHHFDYLRFCKTIYKMSTIVG